MIVVHVAITTVDGYVVRREPHRQAHLDRLEGLRAAGMVIGGGPSPDGRAADVFYRLSRPDELAPLVEEDPYYRGGVWTDYIPRSFTHFVEPREVPPVVVDGSRRLTIAEGPTTDLDMAQLALIELRGTGRLVFGGCLDGNETLAVLRSPDPAEAAGWLVEAGSWTRESLRARPFIYVL